MAPKKRTATHREPAVVYPDTSPQMMIAYRIFGPGHDKLEDLEIQKSRIFKSNPVDGESVFTTLGQDIVESLNVNVAQISAAYMRYEMEIKRMNKAERIHEKRKRAQLDGNEGENEDESTGDSNGDGDDVVEVDADGKATGALKRGVAHDWDEDEDPYEQFLDPALWINKEDALTRARAIRAGLGEMAKGMRTIHAIYNKKKMESSIELDQAMKKSAHNLLALVSYAKELENLINLHDGKHPQTTWKSPAEVNVTFGEKVPWTIHKIYDIEERLWDLKPVMITCKKALLALAKTNLITEKNILRPQLRVRLVRFAAMCLAEEARDKFKSELEEELKQMAEQAKSSKSQQKNSKTVMYENAETLPKD